MDTIVKKGSATSKQSFDEFYFNSTELEDFKNECTKLHEKGFTQNQALHLLKMSGGALCNSRSHSATSDAVSDWVDKSVSAIIEKIGSEKIKADVRAFRVGQDEATIALMLTSADGADHYEISFACGYDHNFDLKEVDVPDFVEVFHMIGLLSQALHFNITMR